MSEHTFKKAFECLEMGLSAVKRGDMQRAREHFKASAFRYPTADAYTYWGWMEHHLGHTDVAIDLCHRAIELDPDFGNPYNDIGSYLIHQGKNDEAIPWLEKALKARRYEPRQYPHVNLSRAYLAKDMPFKALDQLKKALRYSPEDPQILEMMKNIQDSLN
jgi:Tfp pilus assembly protein PilF